MKTFAKHLLATKVKVDGHAFDSRTEARRYGELRLRAMLNEANPAYIRDLEIHPRLPLVVQGNITGRSTKIGRGYIVLDFAYTAMVDGQWRRIYEDVKAIWTREAKLRIALAEAVNEVRINIIEAGS